MYNYNDPDIGLLRRVHGFWRVEVPKKTLGVAVKLDGSDVSGPNKRALAIYKKYKHDLESIWSQSLEIIMEEARAKDGTPRFTQNEFRLSGIMINDPKLSKADIIFTFDIDSAPNEYGACIKDGKFDFCYSLYN